MFRQLNMEKPGSWSFADWAREAFSPNRAPPLEDANEDVDSNKRRRTARGKVDVVGTTREEEKENEERTTAGRKRARMTAPGSKTSSVPWVQRILGTTDKPDSTRASTPESEKCEDDSATTGSQRRRPDLSSEAYSNIFNQLPKLYTPDTIAELERQYWRTLTYSEPLYGADLTGTLMDDVVFTKGDNWNINRLGGQGNLLNTIPKPIAGVNRPYLYFGTWKVPLASASHCHRKN